MAKTQSITKKTVKELKEASALPEVACEAIKIWEDLEEVQNSNFQTYQTK
jgi:hypothetical protein